MGSPHKVALVCVALYIVVPPTREFVDRSFPSPATITVMRAFLPEARRGVRGHVS